MHYMSELVRFVPQRTLYHVIGIKVIDLLHSSW